MPPDWGVKVRFAMSCSTRFTRFCDSSRSSRTTRLVAAPLLALALTGATACEFGSDDEKGTAPGSSGSPASSGKPSDKSGNGGKPATVEQLTEALLTSQEIPAGYTAGDAAVPDPADPDNVVSDPACAILVSDEMDEGATAQIERAYTKDGTGSAGEDQDSVTIGLTGADHDALKKKLDAYIKALRACSSFEMTNGNDSYGFEVANVRTGRHGADSVSYDLTYLSEGEVAGYGSHVVVLEGSTGVSVQAFSLDAMPDEPARFVTGQLGKVGEIGN